MAFAISYRSTVHMSSGMHGDMHNPALPWTYKLCSIVLLWWYYIRASLLIFPQQQIDVRRDHVLSSSAQSNDLFFLSNISAYCINSTALYNTDVPEQSLSNSAQIEPWGLSHASLLRECKASCAWTLKCLVKRSAQIGCVRGSYTFLII